MRSSSSGCSHVCHCSRQEVSLVSTSSCCPRTQGPYGALQASAEPGSGWREHGARRSKDSEALKGLSTGPSPHLQLSPETSHQKTQAPFDPLPQPLAMNSDELSNEKQSPNYPSSQTGDSCYALNLRVSTSSKAGKELARWEVTPNPFEVGSERVHATPERLSPAPWVG